MCGLQEDIFIEHKQEINTYNLSLNIVNLVRKTRNDTIFVVGRYDLWQIDILPLPESLSYIPTMRLLTYKP
jgi:hypothetical protein